MARRNMTQKLIHINKINEQMKLIDGSETDYITPTGKVYKDYGNNFYYRIIDESINISNKKTQIEEIHDIFAECKTRKEKPRTVALPNLTD